MDWDIQVALEPPVILTGSIVRGFKRGSKDLGCPTANLKMTPENIAKTANMVPGVYAARAFLEDRQEEYMCAMSIGWNPVYENAEKTIEAFLVHDFEG